jgi:hypothetical protein
LNIDIAYRRMPFSAGWLLGIQPMVIGCVALAVVVL